MFTEDDLLPLRYLNDLLFCERRVALHLLGQTWIGNQFTTGGQGGHRKINGKEHLKEVDQCSNALLLCQKQRSGDFARRSLAEVGTVFGWKSASVRGDFRFLEKLQCRLSDRPSRSCQGIELSSLRPS